MTGADGEGMFRHASRLDREGSSLNGVPSEQPQLLHLLAETAQTSQRLVFLSGELELLKLEDSGASKTARPLPGSIEESALNSQCKATFWARRRASISSRRISVDGR